MEEDQGKTRNLVIDTNVIISSLIKTEGVTRIAFLLLVNNSSNKVICPGIVVREIKSHENEIARRAHMDSKLLRTALNELLKNIEIVGEETFKDCIIEARNFVNDENDTQFAALALKFKPSFLITHNEKDYKIRGLEKENVIVSRPIEALKKMGVDIVDIKIKRNKKAGIFSVIAKIIASIKKRQ
jgi:predicted nucleic acid-binding protein